MHELRRSVADLWERRDELSPNDREARAVVESVIQRLDRGELRTAEVSAAAPVRRGTFGLPCVLVIERLPEGERHDKSALRDVLRSHGSAA